MSNTDYKKKEKKLICIIREQTRIEKVTYNVFQEHLVNIENED